MFVMFGGREISFDPFNVVCSLLEDNWDNEDKYKNDDIIIYLEVEVMKVVRKMKRQNRIDVFMPYARLTDAIP